MQQQSDMDFSSAYITPHQLVAQLKDRVCRASAYHPGQEINQQSSPDYLTSSIGTDTVWPLHQSDSGGEDLQAVTTASNAAAAAGDMAGSNHITHHNNLEHAAKLNVRGTDYNILANSSPLTNGFFVSDNISSSPLQYNPLYSENRYTHVGELDHQRSQPLSYGNYSPSSDHQASLNIVPITVYNQNTNHQPAAEQYRLAWQGNGLETEAPHHILQHADRKPLTTGNRIPNYHDVRNDIKNSHHNTAWDIDNKQARALCTNISNFGSADSISSRDKDKLAAMASYSSEGHPNTSGKMRVKPMGNDSYMLSVQDTGVHPQSLQQQIIDRAASQPTSPPSWGGYNPRTGGTNPNFFFAPHEHLQSRGGRMESQPVANSFGSQPFMVTWSENGLPRINMMSTPWLSNTLSRQNKGAQPARVSTPPLELKPPDNPHSNYIPNHHETIPRGQGIETHDIPVYKIVGNDWQQADNRMDNHPPPPPPRTTQNTAGGFNNFGTLPPRSSPRYHDSNDNRFIPGFNQTPRNGGPPPAGYMTLPSKQHQAPVPNDPPRPRLYHPGDATLPRNRGNMVKINAPKPIDVTQVPAAGKHFNTAPSAYMSLPVESPSPTSPPELPPRYTPSVTREIDIPIIRRPTGPAEPVIRSDNIRPESPTFTSGVHHRKSRYDNDDRSRSPYITVKQDKPYHEPTPYITVKREPSSNSYVSVKRVDNGADVPAYKLSSMSPSATSASPVPRFQDTLPRPVRDKDKSGYIRLAPAVTDEEAPPRPKSPSGYLQSFLREYKRRSPSPARKNSPPSRDRGRDSGRSRSRSSDRSRQRDTRADRRLRSPSPMPEKSREIVFNDEIDWSDEGRGRTSQTVDWDQIEAVMSCGQDIQRLSVVTSLPHLLRDNKDECLRRVIPKIKEFLPIAQPDMQLAASSIFLQIFQSDIVSSSVFSLHLLPIMLTALDNKDSDIGEAWLEALLEVIPSLSKEVLRKDVMNKAMQKGQLSQNIQSRLISCKILGKISICLESFIIKKEILPLVQSLCQDVEYEVRACMCRQLDLVAKGLGLESTKSAILPELVELANDEESSVRLAGLDTVVSVLNLLDEDTCTNTIIPLVVKFCQGALQDEDSTLPVVSRHLGKLCHGLSHYMTDKQKAWFLDFYKKLCAMGVNDSSHSERNSDINDNLAPKPMSINVFEDDRPIECRVNAAFNFPAMTVFAGGSTKFDAELYPSFSRLCRDPSIPVRKTMASGFHEISRCIGSHVSLLLRDLVVLFKDEYVQVLGGIVNHLPDTMDMLSKVINPDRTQNSGDLLTAILTCDNVIFASNDWRLQEQILENMSSLTQIFSSDQIYNKLIPHIFNKLHNAKARPVRISAVKTMLKYMRCNKKQEQRMEICQRIKTEFGCGKSFRDRTLFIDICSEVLQLFSRTFFKEHFYECALELSSDSVPNIRLRLCHLLPSLKNTIRLPVDRNLLQQLESHVRKLLINERDRDVLSQLKTTVDILDRINCMHDSIHSRRNLTEEDLEDQKKEEDERFLLEQEEKERKEEESEQNISTTSGGSGTKKKGGEKKSSNLLSTSAKNTSSKSNVEHKKQGSATKSSKIPTAPGTKEPRRHSQHSMKTSTTNAAAINGTSITPSSNTKGPSSASGRAAAKITSSNRNVGSPNSTSSSGSINSAGSSRAGRSAGGRVSSPINSAGRRRPELTGHDTQKRDSIPSIPSLRRPSKDGINRKTSH